VFWPPSCKLLTLVSSVKWWLTAILLSGNHDLRSPEAATSDVHRREIWQQRTTLWRIYGSMTVSRCLLRKLGGRPHCYNPVCVCGKSVYIRRYDRDVSGWTVIVGLMITGGRHYSDRLCSDRRYSDNLQSGRPSISLARLAYVEIVEIGKKLEGVEALDASKARHWSRHWGERSLGRVSQWVWVPPPPEKLQRTSNTTVLHLIFGIWFGVFPIGTARRPIQLQSATRRPDCAWTVGIASVGTVSVGIVWCIPPKQCKIGPRLQWKLIGNRIRAYFDCYQNQWPWMTLNWPWTAIMGFLQYTYVFLSPPQKYERRQTHAVSSKNVDQRSGFLAI